MKIIDNVAFGLKRRGDKDAMRKAQEALDLVELGHTGAKKPNQLSGGMQQRVALARAIVNRPNVLLLDEPLGALDLKLRRQMQIELKRIQQEVGLTFIHVTHDQEEAMTMADSIAVMLDGDCGFREVPPEGFEIFWGAYLGMPEEILIAGPLSDVAEEIVATRAAARAAHGWIMDVYLLRRR